jgi:periplasmic protein TonB
MNTIIRAGLVSIPLLATLGGCAEVRTATHAVASSVERVAEKVFHPSTPAPAAAPAPADLTDYKTRVAQQVVARNPDHIYAGTLPAQLPAIVVLEITVAANGRVQDVNVQRSRSPDAAIIAMASVQRSAPLPPPQQLATPAGTLTFSETFLFADDARFQLRSLAEGQAHE